MERLPRAKTTATFVNAMNQSARRRPGEAASVSTMGVGRLCTAGGSTNSSYSFGCVWSSERKKDEIKKVAQVSLLAYHWNDVSTEVKLDWLPLQGLNFRPVFTMIQPQVFVANLQAKQNKKQTTQSGVRHVEEEVPMITITHAIVEPSYIWDIWKLM